MSSSPVPASYLQPHHVHNLILILRRANVHYHHIAARNRAKLQPTHHACEEARRRGLTVDISKAARCDQRQISLVPLPVLDISVSPATAKLPGSVVAQSPPLEVIRLQAQELMRLDAKSPLKKRPALNRAIPGVFIRTTPNGTTSPITLSPTSHLSSVSLSLPVVPSAVLRRKLVSSVRPLSVWTAGEPMRCMKPSREPLVGIPDSPGAQEWRPLDVPIDEEDMDWGLDDISDMVTSPSPSFDYISDSASSGTQSSLPLTPVGSCIASAIHYPLTSLRII